MRDDNAVTAILGTLLMLALMMTLALPAMTFRNEAAAAFEAQTDAARAEKEAAQLAAFCARNPEVGEPVCPSAMPGYTCTKETAGTRLICTPNQGSTAPTMPLWGTN